MRLLAVFLLLFAASNAALGAGWWNPDWPYRKQIKLDPGLAGVKEGLANAVVPVRLHTGNFLFVDAKPDGADIRFVAADDKTPLRFHVESFDTANQLAILWVQVPRLSAAEPIWMYYGNQKVPSASDPKTTYEPSTTLVLHFAEAKGTPRDSTAYGHSPAQSSAALDIPGPIGNGARFDGNASIAIPAAPALKLNAQSGFTFSAWVKPEGTQSRAVLYAHSEGARSIQLAIDGARLIAQVAGNGKPVEVAAALAPDAWHHVALTLSQRLALYVDGREAASAEAAVPDLGGEIVIGAGLRGELDELQLASVARAADWVKAQYDSQAPDGKLIAYGVDEESGGAGHSYFGILIDNLTLDAWVVIVILLAMLAWSFLIMIAKARFLIRTERANAAFIEKFEELSDDLMRLDEDVATSGKPNGVPDETKLASQFARSPMYRLYHIGVRELLHRFDIYRKKGMTLNLTPQAIDAIRAALDAGVVRENARLNSQMVLLTIAISGGPFLGLLGTVVGVMITFAAVAAAGDVNVNAIAPGIAAALLATVAGLAVAIPALFGYNWLASRIKSIANDMQVFVDELLTKLAESYSA